MAVWLPVLSSQNNVQVDYDKKEWIPDPTKKYVFDSNGFHISGATYGKVLILRFGAILNNSRQFIFFDKPWVREKYDWLKQKLLK
jgi:hypothetical protein